MTTPPIPEAIALEKAVEVLASAVPLCRFWPRLAAAEQVDP